MNKSEKIVKELLETRYDRVIRPSKGTYKYTNMTEYVFLGAHFSKEVGYTREQKLDHFITRGVPDFIAYDADGLDSIGLDDIKINDYICVEVKKKGDGLSIPQLQWFNRFPQLKSKIFLVSHQNKKIKSLDIPEIEKIEESEEK